MPLLCISLRRCQTLFSLTLGIACIINNFSIILIVTAIQSDDPWMYVFYTHIKGRIPRRSWIFYI